VEEEQAVVPRPMADGEGDLFERLEAMSRAEPLSAEDDLILRMSAVSKLKSRKGMGVKDKQKGKSKAMITSPAKGIAKRRQQPRRETMKIDMPVPGVKMTSEDISRAAVAAVEEAAAAARSRRRSNSI